MKDTLANKLTSFTAALAVLDTPGHLAIWKDKSPLAFTTDVALARAGVAGLGSAGAQQSSPITGSAQALRELRENFETQLHILARATYQFLKKAGRTEDAVKADLAPSKLHDARAVNLAGLGEIILDLAEPLTVSPAPGQPAPGENLGITAALFGGVDDLWERYSTAVGAPIGARAKRKTLTGELPGKFRRVEEAFSDLDDLILQFGTDAAGREFVNAWFNARHVVALGRRYEKKTREALPPVVS